MKSTKGLKAGDKLYWYEPDGERREVVIHKMDGNFVIATTGSHWSIRCFHGRIKPPEPRLECWANLYSGGLSYAQYGSEKIADREANIGRIRCVHLREVRKKVKK